MYGMGGSSAADDGAPDFRNVSYRCEKGATVLSIVRSVVQAEWPQSSIDASGRVSGDRVQVLVNDKGTSANWNDDRLKEVAQNEDVIEVHRSPFVFDATLPFVQEGFRYMPIRVSSSSTVGQVLPQVARHMSLPLTALTFNVGSLTALSEQTCDTLRLWRCVGTPAEQSPVNIVVCVPLRWNVRLGGGRAPGVSLSVDGETVACESRFAVAPETIGALEQDARETYKLVAPLGRFNVPLRVLVGFDPSSAVVVPPRTLLRDVLAELAAGNSLWLVPVDACCLVLFEPSHEAYLVRAAPYELASVVMNRVIRSTARPWGAVTMPESTRFSALPMDGSTLFGELAGELICVGEPEAPASGSGMQVTVNVVGPGPRAWSRVRANRTCTARTLLAAHVRQWAGPGGEVAGGAAAIARQYALRRADGTLLDATQPVGDPGLLIVCPVLST